MNIEDRRKRDRGPKGRPLDDGALAEVRALLGRRERRRDLLIEHLHLIQDTHGCLSAAHLRGLAEDMRRSLVSHPVVDGDVEVAAFLGPGHGLHLLDVAASAAHENQAEGRGHGSDSKRP